MSTMELMNAPGVAMVLFLYAHVMLLGLAYTAGQSPSLPPPSPQPIKLTPNSSVASFLVLGCRNRRLWLLSEANIVLPHGNRHQPSHLATLRLPNPTTPIRNRRRTTRLSLHVANIFHFRACLQRLLEEWMDNCVLDHHAAATDCGERGRYGFQYASCPISFYWCVSVILTSSSWCSTRIKRYLALALLPWNSQWSCSDLNIWYPNRRASHFHESLCNGSKNTVLEWISGLGCACRDCGRGFVRGEVPP
jgi:hypothetical protein